MKTVLFKEVYGGAKWGRTALNGFANSLHNHFATAPPVSHQEILERLAGSAPASQGLEGLNNTVIL